MQDKQNIDRSSRPWTYWLLRYIASDNRQALSDLIWSVGGSPPYGNIAYNEASAIYALLEEYMGMASDVAYAALRREFVNELERLKVLGLFR